MSKDLLLGTVWERSILCRLVLSERNYCFLRIASVNYMATAQNPKATINWLIILNFAVMSKHFH